MRPIGWAILQADKRTSAACVAVSCLSHSVHLRVQKGIVCPSLLQDELMPLTDLCMSWKAPNFSGHRHWDFKGHQSLLSAPVSNLACCCQGLREMGAHICRHLLWDCLLPRSHVPQPEDRRARDFSIESQRSEQSGRSWPWRESIGIQTPRCEAPGQHGHCRHRVGVFPERKSEPFASCPGGALHLEQCIIENSKCLAC